MTRRSERTESVLVPTGRQMKSYACMRSLDRRGVNTVVASEYDSIPHFSSRHCSERVTLSSSPADLTAYRDALLDLAARPDVETVVPVREADVFLFAKYADLFDEHVSLVSPGLDLLERGHDRLRLARAAEEAGVPYAETRLLGDVDDWGSRSIVKSRYNVLTGEYLDSYPDDGVEEVKLVRYLEPGEEPDPGAIRAEMKHEPIVQEFVPQADKQLYCGLWDHGEPLAEYQHREIRGSSWVGGGGVYRVSDHSEAVEAVARDLLEHVGWHGLACIEYIQDAETGEWKFLEINPRMWQSLPSTVRAGADFPYYYWQCARGEADRIDPTYETGVGCHQLYGELGHLLSLRSDESPLAERPSVAGTVWDIVRSCVTDPRFDYLHLDDPRLFASSIYTALTAGGSGGGSRFEGGVAQPQSPASGD